MKDQGLQFLYNDFMKAKAGLRVGLPRLVTYLAVPLLGWWLGGLAGAVYPDSVQSPALLAEPARIAFLVAAILQAAIAWRLAGLLPSSEPIYPAQPGGIYWRNYALETSLMLAPYCDRRDFLVFADTPTLRWSGLLLFLLGTGLALWSGFLYSRAAVERNAGSQDPLLLVEGPFRRLRFPGYLGLLVLSLGIALVFRSWLGLGALAFILNYVVMRINAEEKLASLKFGIQWTAYRRHSWRLVPYIF